MRRRIAIAWLRGAVALTLTLGASRAAAQQPQSTSFEYSPYEKETIAGALKETGRQIDPAPEGKTIGRIETFRLEVLEERDPIPEELVFGLPNSKRRAGVATRDFGNSLHSVSRDFVIRRAVLLKQGDRFERVVADETARNMRGSMPLQLSIVIIVPLKTSTADTVDLLVITKDIWSLRLSFDIGVTAGGVERLVIVPQETNLFGNHHTVSTRFQYQPESYTFGGGYKVPRFGASWIGAAVGVTATINRRTGEAEGSAASFSVGQGLYSTKAEWAWGADASYAVGVSRRYINARLATFDSQTTPDILDNIPQQLSNRSFGASVSVTRSFGSGIKNNFGLSLNASSLRVRTGDLTPYDPRAAKDYVDRFVPIGETRVYPALSWVMFTNNFVRTLDVSTLALQEDFRVGPEVGASVYPVRTELGSTRDLIGVNAHASYTQAFGDGFASASVGTFAENASGILTDASYSGGISTITPRLGFGRLFMSSSFVSRYRNYLRSNIVTGGDDRLRGYPSNFFVGKDAVFYNIEFRSTSVEILKCALGAVAFFDAGDAAEGFSALRAKQSVGFGVRVLVPQVNRLVFRFDLAFPLKRGPFPETGIPTPVDPVGFFFAFGQAF